MKKMIAVLTALAMCLGCAAAFAGEAAPAGITAENWLAETMKSVDWIEKDGRATMEIEPILSDVQKDGEVITAVIYAPESAFEGIEWRVYCGFDPDTHAVIGKEVSCSNQAYDENGELSRSDEVYTRPAAVTFEVGADGLLTVTDPEEDGFGAIVFEPIASPEMKVKPLDEAQTALFTGITGKLMGVDYEPVGVVSEMDSMLCLLCNATVVYPGAQSAPVMMLIDSQDPEFPGVTIIDLAPAPAAAE